MTQHEHFWAGETACELFKEGEELENYTKYQLKDWGELADLLEGKDNLFVISCNKCFKEFDTTQEPEQEQFLKLAEGFDKHITGTAKADFLCNKATPVDYLLISKRWDISHRYK